MLLGEPAFGEHGHDAVSQQLTRLFAPLQRTARERVARQDALVRVAVRAEVGLVNADHAGKAWGADRGVLKQL